MAAVPRWSLEALPGFLEPLVADPDMGYCDGEGAEHYTFRVSVHIRRRAFSRGGFKFFCWHKFLELESVTMRISIWSVKKKQKQVRPQNWFSKDRKLSRSRKRRWSEQPRYGDIRGPSVLLVQYDSLSTGHRLLALISALQLAKGGIKEDKLPFRDTCWKFIPLARP